MSWILGKKSLQQSQTMPRGNWSADEICGLQSSSWCFPPPMLITTDLSDLTFLPYVFQHSCQWAAFLYGTSAVVWLQYVPCPTTKMQYSLISLALDNEHCFVNSKRTHILPATTEAQLVLTLDFASHLLFLCVLESKFTLNKNSI